MGGDSWTSTVSLDFLQMVESNFDFEEPEGSTDEFAA
jgi:hypothetical protein